MSLIQNDKNHITGDFFVSRDVLVVDTTNGRIGINTTTPTFSLDIVGDVSITTTTGALTLPRLTTGQRDALTGVAGMLVYNASTNKLNVYTGAAWEVITSA